MIFEKTHLRITWNEALIVVDACNAADDDGYEAVSYTHLDVYKRQT